MRSLITALFLLITVAVGAACQSDADPGEEDQVRIAASTALIAEFASIVAGDDAQVTGLIPAGVDLHSFEPAPATVAVIAAADIVFVNGYNLEESLLGVVLENVASDAEVVAVAAGLIPLEGGHHHEDDEDGDADHEDHEDGDHDDHEDVIRASGDPHLWLDVSNAMHYVEQIRDHLIERDPEAADRYRDRASAYLEELDALNQEVASAIGTIPEANRQLVVLHDAYGYLGHAYGLEVVASLLPAGAQSDPSAGEVVALIELIEERGVMVIYREPQFSASVLDRVAEETGTGVLVLYSTFADGIDSYVELMRADAAALVEGLGS